MIDKIYTNGELIFKSNKELNKKQIILKNISYGNDGDSEKSKPNNNQFPIIQKLKYENYDNCNKIDQKKEFCFFGKEFTKYNLL